MLTTTTSYLAESMTPIGIAAGSAADFFFYALLGASIAFALVGVILAPFERDLARRNQVLGLSIEGALLLGAAALTIRLVAWMCGIGYPLYSLGQAAPIMIAAIGLLTLANVGLGLLTSPLTDDGSNSHQQSMNN